MSAPMGSKLTITNTTFLQQRTHVKGEEKDVETLSLKLLNKRSRLRLSSKDLDCSRLPGKSSLFAVGNHKAYFAAIIHQDDGAYMHLSHLSDIREFLNSGQAISGPYIPFTPKRSPLKLAGVPHIVKFALNDERIVLGFVEGHVLVYSTDDVLNSSAPSPTYALPGSALMPPRDILPNPGESPELIAILRGLHGDSMECRVDIVNVRDNIPVVGWLRSDDPEVSPVCISWSPRGKQIALGLRSGDILLYSPLTPDTPKSHIPRSPSVPPDASSLLSIVWLANHTFYMVFTSEEALFSTFDGAMSGSLTKSHIIFAHDPKSRSAVDIELMDPSPPFGAAFPPGPLSVVLRGWSPTKFILICGDGPSADIGLLGAISDETWVNITLEETSTPSLPLGENSQDMALLGLDIDLTSTKSVRVSDQPDDGTPDLSPSPILYAYMSDGTLVAWHVLNSGGDPYPGMVSSVAPAGISSATPSTPMSVESKPVENVPQTQYIKPTSAFAPARGFGAFAATGPSKFGATGFTTNIASATTTPVVAPLDKAPAFGSTGFAKPAAPAFGSTGFAKPAAPAFGSTGFAKPAAPAFGSIGFAKPAAPAFGSTGFGKAVTPAFGSTGFGTAAAAPAFGQTGFGAVSTAPPKIAASPSGGFAAFATQKVSGFGVASNNESVFESVSAPTSPHAPPVSSSPESPFGPGGPIQSTQNVVFGFNQSQSTEPATVPPLWTQALASEAQESHMNRSSSQPPSVMGTPLPDNPEFPPTSLSEKSAPLSKPSGFGTFMKPSNAFTRPGDELKPVSSFIKPAEGFGAAQQMSPTSPFAQTKPLVPSFGSAGFGVPVVPSGGTSKPTFGSVSALGSKQVFGVSSFGVSKPVVSEPSKPISGGFEAFSSVSGFASFANPATTTSFSDLLSQPDISKKDEAPPVLGGPTEKSPAVVSASTTSTVSAFSPTHAPKQIAEAPKQDAEAPKQIAEEPKQIAEAPKQIAEEAKQIAEAPTVQSDKTPKARIDGMPTGDVDKATVESLVHSEDSTFSLVSLSEAASQLAEMPAAERRDKDKPPTPEEPEDDAVSEPFYLTDSTLEESDVSGEGKPKSHSGTPSLPESEDKEPEDIPLPETSPPTPVPSTPRPSTPVLPVVDVAPTSTPKPTPPLFAATSDKNNLLPNPPQSAFALQPVAPKPALPSSIFPAFGLGRPSSRPIRSSPLASAPITGNIVEDTPAVGLPSSKTMATKDVALNKMPRSVPMPNDQPSISDGTISRRPKTPPLWGVMSRPVVTSKTTSEADRRDQERYMHPMQAEFQNAYEVVQDELVQLQQEVQHAAMTRKNLLTKSNHPDKPVQSNQDSIPGPTSYSLGELQSFTVAIAKLRRKITPLADQDAADKRLLQELQNLALISETKQEELSRWVRARNDPEFAKTIKPRTLGPEHAENQIQLRKALHSMHQRVQQCEDQIESLKKCLDQEKTGRITLRPPSLDTIDRTCRNIQLALEERAKLIERLQVSVNELSPRDSGRLHQTPNNGHISASSDFIAPPFASMAAAALNSERSSLKLKEILLRARKQPLLTTKTVEARKGLPKGKITPLAPHNWDSTSEDPKLGDNRSSQIRKTKIASPFPKDEDAATRLSSFDWGPLPTQTGPTTTKLPFDMRSSK